MRYDKEKVESLLLQDKNSEVVNELVERNLGLVYCQLNKFNLRNDPDAISYGYEALYKAIMTYTPESSSKFSTYATVCIYNRLGSYVRTLNTNIILNTSSYEEPIGKDDIRLVDVLESPHTADADALSKAGIKGIQMIVAEEYHKIEYSVHREIVGMWVESGFTATQTRIAEAVGCSQTNVAQVLKKFKLALKKRMEEQ